MYMNKVTLDPPCSMYNLNIYLPVRVFSVERVSDLVSHQVSSRVILCIIPH